MIVTMTSRARLRCLIQASDTSPHQVRWRDEDRARAMYRLSLNLQEQFDEGINHFLSRKMLELAASEGKKQPGAPQDYPEIRGLYQEAEHYRTEALKMRSQWDHLIPKWYPRDKNHYSTERRQMARFDYCVYLWHGRTAGVWNPNVKNW